MEMCVQGKANYLKGINNQDYIFKSKRVGIVLGGCNLGKCSEVGTRLFIQLFSKLPEFDVPEKFEENVSLTFERMLKICEGYSKKQISNFISENYLFTILACFSIGERFEIKVLGDGYIISVNINDMVSFFELPAHKTSLKYYASRYLDGNRSNISFATYMFNKYNFKSLGIASNGIKSLIKEGRLLDHSIINGSNSILDLASDTYNDILYDNFSLIMMN